MKPCEELPSAWLDPSTPEEVQWAMDGCSICPVLQQCKDFSGKFRWHFPTVVAGWQPPDKAQSSAGGGFLPPWTPKGYKVLRPLTGAREGSRNRP